MNRSFQAAHQIILVISPTPKRTVFVPFSEVQLEEFLEIRVVEAGGFGEFRGGRLVFATALVWLW
jgi:hypothetical protein